jgi:predicted glycosyltransferase
MFFNSAVNLLKQAGHEVLCTSRDYREAVELAKLKQLDIKIIGRHGGADRYNKLEASITRTADLAKVIKQFKPDTAVTFSSPEAARVAFGLGIHHIGFNDSPHAQAVARLTIPLMDKLLCPWVIPYKAWTGYGIARNYISRYHALDPVAWLKDTSNNKIHPINKNEFKNITVLIRLEESKASYIADKKLGTEKLIDDFIDQLSSTINIVILCRYPDQIDEIEARYGSKIHVIKDVINGSGLISSVHVFIGGGGTMTAEAALLGKPTISIAPVQYHVEKYLIKTGLVWKVTDPRSLIKTTRKMITDRKLQEIQKRKAERILSNMEDPTNKIIEALIP